MPYLDQAGLSAFWGKVKNWVASQSAKSMAKGTASTDGIPLTMSNGAATPVVLSTVKITKEDIAATGAKVTDTVYTHPAGGAPSKASGLYKFATDATSHVASVAAVTSADIKALETDPTVPAWAKASTKPSYKASEVSNDSDATGATVEEALGLHEEGIADLQVNKQDKIGDLDTIREGAKKGATALQSFTETDPTVPAWAKASTKPAYDATEVALGEASGAWFDDGGSVDDALDHLLNTADTLETNIGSLAGSKAPIASPTLTGTPKAPTAAAGTNTTQIATTAFVSTAVANAMTGAAKYKGAITPTSYAALKAYTQGWYWVVTTAGSIAGETCEIGDMVFCNATKSGLSAPAAADFDVVQNNITAIPESVINGLS